MKITSIYFSPTRSTKKYIQTVTEAMGSVVQEVDITLPECRENQVTIHDELIVLGFPIYGMRIPKLALDYFSKLQGNQNPLAAVAVYGNIDTGIVIKQLEKMARKQNFHLVGVGCFVAQHAYSTDDYPVAAARPTFEDLMEAQHFGQKLSEKVNADDMRVPIFKKSLIPLIIDKAPYGGTKKLLVQPRVNLNLCTHCNRCIKHCPAGAIRDDLQIIESQCLRCLNCVVMCPSNARESHFKAKWMGKGLAWMGKESHPNQFFL